MSELIRAALPMGSKKCLAIRTLLDVVTIDYDYLHMNGVCLKIDGSAKTVCYLHSSFPEDESNLLKAQPIIREEQKSTRVLDCRNNPNDSHPRVIRETSCEIRSFHTMKQRND